MRRTMVVAVVVAATALTVLAGTPFAGTEPSGGVSSPRVPGGTVERLLVVSLPHVTWEALEQAETPNLDRLFEASALANLSVRTTIRKTDSPSGYTTIGAGTRATAPGSSGGLALAPQEDFENSTALEVYQRRMGHGTDAAVIVPSVPEFVRRNDALLFGAEVGVLGTALRDAGIHRAVIGNADRNIDASASSDHRRSVAVALMDREGRVPGGRVDRGLLVRDASAPFGLRLSHETVVETFRAEWERGERVVVIVEASDMIRAEAYRSFMRPSLRDPTSEGALEDADDLVGGLLASVDPDRDGVLVIAPASPRAKPRLTVAALRTPGEEGSFLRSATTRRGGSVTIADVGAGIAHLMGAERPPSMEGRPFETEASREGATSRRDRLARVERGAVFRDANVGVMSAVFVALQLAIGAAAVVALRFQRGRRTVAFAALVVLAVLPMTYLAGLIDFARAGRAPYFVFLFGCAAVLGTVAWVLGRRDPVASVGWVLVAVVGVIVGNVVLTEWTLQLNTVFGDSPIVAGRFNGINNLSFAQVATGGILLAVLLAHRLGARLGAAAASGLLVFLLIVVGLPAWGANVGGVLTCVPAFGYVAYRLWGRSVRWSTVLVLGLAAIVVLGAFTLYDLAQPAGERSHLGRLVEQVEGQGGEALFIVVLRKILSNLRVITSSVWLFMVPGALAFYAFLVWQRPHLVQVIEHRIPMFSIALGGVLVAGVVGWAVNDSGIAVPGMALGTLNPVMVHLSMRMARPEQHSPDPAASPATIDPVRRG